MQLKTRSKLAVVAARGLGDGLLSLILSENFRQSGHSVTTFSTILCQMADWFPSHTIAPFNEFEERNFDHIFAADHSMIRKSSEKVTILYESQFNKKQSMVENLSAFARRYETKGSTQTGLVSPDGLHHRLHQNRVVLHPMSSDSKKNWLPKRFRALSKKLKKLGYEPIFCVSPEEKSFWPEAKSFDSISSLAAFIYESGYLIGNDSGLGHLASLLQIPTLSIFARKSYSRLWRPGWGHVEVVTPPIPLIGAPMKQRYWKNILTTQCVKNNFKYLVKVSYGL